VTPLLERCNGRWRSILPALGIDQRYLTGKQSPCPICGGRDRFRWDNKRGDGTFFCNWCGAGQGIKLAMLFTGISDFKEIATKIDAVLGEAPREQARAERSQAEHRANMNRLWQGSRPVRAGDHVDKWMRRRGIALDSYPSCLQAHPGLRHRDSRTVHPGMLAKMVDASGKPVMLHRTFMTEDGRKAPVGNGKVRMFCAGAGMITPGSAVRLKPAAKTMGIAEGLETALASAQLFGMPVWAALSDNGVAKFEPPTIAEHLVIMGDHDANGAGQRAAYALASRLRIRVEVKIPDAPDSDWNDVLRVTGGA
jgi:putative DNA primase/helicase